MVISKSHVILANKKASLCRKSAFSEVLLIKNVKMYFRKGTLTFANTLEALDLPIWWAAIRAAEELTSKQYDSMYFVVP